MKALDFQRDESGAVTTDWVILTAAGLLLAASVVISVRIGAVSVGTNLNAAMETNEVADVGAH